MLEVLTTSNRPSESIEVESNNPFRVFIPGATGGGKGLTSIREYLHEKYGESVFIPSSISSPMSLKKGESIDSHYTSLAHEVIKKSNGRDIEFIAHSFGGFEIVDLLNKFFQFEDPQSLTGRKITLNFISVAGFTSKGMETVTDLVKALHLFESPSRKKLDSLAAFFEQHMVYPLPEEYYRDRKTTPKIQNSFLTSIEDTPEKREERRETFRKDWLLQLRPESDTQKEIIEKLNSIDQQLVSPLVQDREMDRLLGERAKELEGVLQDIFRGNHILDEKHAVMLNRYREWAEDLAKPFQFYINALLYVSRVGSYIKRGMGKVIEELIDTAKAKNVNMKIQFTLLEHDMLLPITKIGILSDTVSSGSIGDALEGFNFAQQYAHSSVGYYPQILSELFTKPPSVDK